MSEIVMIELVSLSCTPLVFSKKNIYIYTFINIYIPNSSASGYLSRPTRPKLNLEIKQHSKSADVLSPAYYVSKIYIRCQLPAPFQTASLLTFAPEQ